MCDIFVVQKRIIEIHSVLQKNFSINKTSYEQFLIVRIKDMMNGLHWYDDRILH